MKTPNKQTLRARWASDNGSYGYEIHQVREGVVVSCPWGKANVDEIHAYVGVIREQVRSQPDGRCVLVLDYGRLEKTDPEARRIFMQSIENMQPPLAGIVFARLKPILRIFVRLGRRIAKVPYPVLVETTLEQALDSASRLLDGTLSPYSALTTRKAMIRRFVPRFVLRAVVRELREELAEFPWDSGEREEFPVPAGHPLREIFEMWGTVKDELDRVDSARQRHMVELGAAVRALRESEHRYRAVFEASGAAMLIHGEDGIVRLANEAALRMGGRTREEMLDRFDWTSMAHPDDRDRLLEFLSGRTGESDGRGRIECRFLDRDGAELVASVSVADVPGTDLRVTSLDDLTETRRAEAEIVRLARSLETRVSERTAELEAANVRIAEALRSREEFLASMSHELRTPLASILNLSESLESGVYGPILPRQGRALATIGSNGQHLLDLITDILDLSKSQAGRLQLRPSGMSLSKAVRDAVAMVLPAAQQRGLSVETELSHGHDEILADPLRVKQMVVNLLSNAVKFTPPNGRVGVRTGATDPDSETVSIEVWDEGIGISDVDRDRLFQPFVQLDNRLSREHAGTGLGLSLTRSLVLAHQGTIRLDSAPGKGSCFRIELPRGEIPRSAAIPEPTTSPGTREASPTDVLVIEDNSDLRGVLADYLEAVGATVHCAGSGSEGLRILESRPVDVVLLDVQMPGMDGYEVMRRIRSDPSIRDLPVVAMTGLAFDEDVQRCLEAGASVHVPKPLRMSELVRLVDSLKADRSPVAR